MGFVSGVVGLFGTVSIPNFSFFHSLTKIKVYRNKISTKLVKKNLNWHILESNCRTFLEFGPSWRCETGFWAETSYWTVNNELFWAPLTLAWFCMRTFWSKDLWSVLVNQNSVYFWQLYLKIFGETSGSRSFSSVYSTFTVIHFKSPEFFDSSTFDILW